MKRFFVRRWWRRFLKRLLIVLVVVVLSFEAFLNLGMVVWPRVFTLFQRFEDPDSLKVLCIGDSHTAGMEAGDGFPYPETLAGLFEEMCPEVRVEVLNSGQGGFDTRSIATGAEWTLKRLHYMPDVVIVQGGINTICSSWETSSAYYRANSDPVYRHPVYFSLFVFGQIKTLRLLLSRSERFSDSFLNTPTKRAFGNRINEEVYGSLVRMVRNRGIVPVFLSYAACGTENLIATMDNVARINGVPFLLFPQPETTAFLADRGWLGETCHPNGDGYRFVAMWTYRFLVETIPALSSCSGAEEMGGPLPEGRYFYRKPERKAGPS